MTQPNLPLPPPLRGTDQDNPFAHQTITNRLPRIARQTLQSRAWHAEAQRGLQALLAEMPHGKMTALDDPHAPDAAAWERDFAPYLGQTWLEAPWFAAETYFFRRILQATDYYQPGAGFMVDPYLMHKEQDLPGILPAIQQFYAAAGAGHPSETPPPQANAELLARRLRLAIWGNQADRSMWPAGSSEQPDAPAVDRLDEMLLADQSREASQTVCTLENSRRRIDFILDNAGMELAYDLVLVDFLLRTGLAEQTRLHVKPHPTYVSDATAGDVLAMIEFLEGQAPGEFQALGQRLLLDMDAGRLQLRSDYFWTSPLPGWQMPGALLRQLSEAGLLINKGDANYRRWVGDRHWPPETPLEQVLQYAPSPWLALRVIKANTIAGLQPGVAQAAAQIDAHWQTSGRWGVIQFVRKR
jgi:hypothetical protein